MKTTKMTLVDCPADASDCTIADHFHDPDGRAWAPVPPRRETEPRPKLSRVEDD
jgi:hypothetical protein